MLQLSESVDYRSFREGALFGRVRYTLCDAWGALAGRMGAGLSIVPTEIPSSH